MHHRTYKNIGNEPLKDLAVLCAGCHAKEHGLELPYWYEVAERDGMKSAVESFIRNCREPRTKSLSAVLEQVLENLPPTNRKQLEQLK